MVIFPEDQFMVNMVGLHPTQQEAFLQWLKDFTTKPAPLSYSPMMKGRNFRKELSSSWILSADIFLCGKLLKS